MREFEPAANVLVGQVGYWLPYDPENMEDIKANFREEQLNEIYGQRQEELEKSRADFDSRKHKMIEKNKQEQELKKQLFNSKTHQEQKEEKEDLVVVDEDQVEKPKKNEKPKPQPANKAGNMRIKRKH
jgi:exonuclease VII large subunit